MLFSLLSTTWGLSIHHNHTLSSNTIRLDLSPPTTVEDAGSAFCSDGKVFKECGSACPRSCSGFGRPEPTCIAVCVSGCFCDDGYMLDEATDKCVKVTTPEYCVNMPCPWQDPSNSEPNTLICGDGSAHDTTKEGAWEACTPGRGGRAICPRGHDMCSNMECSPTGCLQQGGMRKCLETSPNPRCASFDGDCAACLAAGCALSGDSDKCFDKCRSPEACYHIAGERTATEVSQVCLAKEESARKRKVCALLNQFDCGHCTQVPFCSYARDAGGCISECPLEGCGEHVSHSPAECSS